MANLSQEKRQRLRAFLETIHIIQPEPLLKLRLNYYKQLFYLVLPCNIQMKLIFTNNFLVE